MPCSFIPCDSEENLQQLECSSEDEPSKRQLDSSSSLSLGEATIDRPAHLSLSLSRTWLSSRIVSVQRCFLLLVVVVQSRCGEVLRLQRGSLLPRRRVVQWQSTRTGLLRW